MIGVGGLSHKHYPETKGLKIISGQFVKKGTILTREGGKWRAGVNIGGKNTIYALCDGKVYFSIKRGTYKTKKKYTYVNVKAQDSKKK